MYIRKIESTFQSWLDSPSHKPIVVKGVRQCGKTSSVVENLVADILGKMGRKLYYYHKNGGIELDFLMRHKGQCVPIECKATTGNAKSMRTVLGHPEKYHVDFAIKLGDYNVGMKDKLLTLPMYMAFLLNEV